MKRFSPREFALLCSPLFVVAIAGFLLSRRKPPSVNKEKVHLEFYVDKPTTLEAFNGSDAALVADLKGPNTEPGTNPLRIWNSDAYLELKTSQGTQKSLWRAPKGDWKRVWKGNYNLNRFCINSHFIPRGALQFGFDAVICPSASLATPIHLV